MRPRLAAFPKCFMDQLCVDRTMTVFEWIELAATLGVDGLEFYSGFLRDDDGFLRECWDAHQSGIRDWSALLWCVLMFRAWEDASVRS